MRKRLYWLSIGYVSGTLSSWWVSRKVRRTAERVLPDAVRSEVTTRVHQFGRRVTPVPDQARKFLRQLRPEDIDLTDRVTTSA